jgi:hypothetical protein
MVGILQNCLVCIFDEEGIVRGERVLCGQPSMCPEGQVFAVLEIRDFGYQLIPEQP